MRLLKGLMLVTMLPMLSAGSCAKNTTETVRTISDFCLQSRPITYSKKQPTQVETAENKYDTDETVTQVQQHDLVYERICVNRTQ